MKAANFLKVSATIYHTTRCNIPGENDLYFALVFLHIPEENDIYFVLGFLYLIILIFTTVRILNFG